MITENMEKDKFSSFIVGLDKLIESLKPNQTIAVDIFDMYNANSKFEHSFKTSDALGYELYGYED